MSSGSLLPHTDAASLSDFVCTQKTKEFDAFAQTPLRHLPASQHFSDDLPDLARAKVEALVEFFRAVVDLFLREMRIADRGKLYAFFVDQVAGLGLLQPAALERLPIHCRTGIGRSQ